MPAVRASASGDRLTNGLAAVAAILILTAAVLFCVYPVYPATGTLCDIVEDRSTPSALLPILTLLPDEWALRYLSRGGAIVRVDGYVHGGPPGSPFYFHTPCRAWNVYAELNLPEAAAVSAHTRAELRALPTSDPSEDRSIEASLIARVDRIGGGGCFGPGMTMTALAIETRGPRTVVHRGP
jgi:hypothetical protein